MRHVFVDKILLESLKKEIEYRWLFRDSVTSIFICGERVYYAWYHSKGRLNVSATISFTKEKIKRLTLFQEGLESFVFLPKKEP